MKEAFERASSVLQADKSVMSDGCQALVLQDLKEKFSEFFAVTGTPKMQIFRDGDVYSVTISFQAESVKKFNVIQ